MVNADIKGWKFYCNNLSADLHANAGSRRARLLCLLRRTQLAQYKYSEAEGARTETLALSISIGCQKV